MRLGWFWRSGSDELWCIERAVTRSWERRTSLRRLIEPASTDNQELREALRTQAGHPHESMSFVGGGSWRFMRRTCLCAVESGEAGGLV